MCVHVCMRVQGRAVIVIALLSISVNNTLVSLVIVRNDNLILQDTTVQCAGITFSKKMK